MKALMNTKEVSDYLRHSIQTLAKWRVYGQGPRWVKLGRSVFYDRHDVDAWIESKSHQSTAEG